MRSGWLRGGWHCPPPPQLLFFCLQQPLVSPCYPPLGSFPQRGSEVEDGKKIRRRSPMPKVAIKPQGHRSTAQADADIFSRPESQTLSKLHIRKVTSKPWRRAASFSFQGGREPQSWVLEET